MEDIWFEEKLMPSPGVLESQTKHLIEQKELSIQEMHLLSQGIVRVSVPKWGLLGECSLRSSVNSKLWKVRLRFQFDLKYPNVRFTFAHCEAFLESIHKNEAFPTVFDFFPKELYEGNPQMVSLRFSPNFKVAGFEASLGELSTDIELGQIAPVVIGFPGKDDRAPYWQLSPGKFPIRGTRDFWIVIEQPEGCSGIRVRVRAEGVLQTFWGPVAIYPENRVWDRRPSFVIS